MLVAVDIHDRPEDTLRGALPWARLLGRRVDLVFASEWSPVGVQPPHPEPELEERIREWGMRAAAERVRLDALVARLPEAYRGQPVFLSGRPLDVLPSATRATSVTVVATHDRGRLGRALLGSVSLRLVREAQGPVLVLHLDAPHVPADPPHVCVPVDLDDASGALPRVRRLLPDARITLVYVLPMPGWDSAFTSTADATAALATLARAQRCPDAEVAVLPPHRRPGDAIAGWASANGADVIAVPTRGRTGLQRLALGSVTERILSRAPMPVLVTRLG